MNDSSMRIVLAICLAVLTTSSCWAQDLFVGVFESESRANFGTSTPGEYRIEIVPAPNGNYVATIYQRGKRLGHQELITCPVESEAYLRNRPAGRAEVLCRSNSYGKPLGFISFSENGIYITDVKPKYAKNPDLVEQEGLKPGDPSLFESRHHTARYYANVGAFIFGFRKVSE
ncbi:MAG TPA: hypothetical protein VFB63_06230 [Bryobacteraceae bacterium]|nr:hypothetical protein [Bryobacteraceae bacterium]